jgi:peptide deformylase
MVQPIRQDGDEALRQIAQNVPEELFGTPELRHMLADMEDTLDNEADGVALAGPQIGLSYRIFVVRFDRMIPPPAEGEPRREKEIGVFINPTFVNSSRHRDVMEEGCLSVRGIYGKTLRHERATVRARAEDGSVFERGGGGILAQAYQHEIDHLDGILFVDHAQDLFEHHRTTPDAA